MILVLDRRATSLRHERGVLRIDSADADPRRVPIGQLESVIVYGNPLAETAVWRALAAANVAVILLPLRGHDGAVVLAGGLAATLPLRRLQHQCAADPARALALARWFVGHKLAGYDLPLGALDRRHDTDPTRRAAFLARRDAALAALPGATGIDALMGSEGQVANAWFGLLTATLQPAWNFNGRNRRPPRDPVNAMLSLGYSLVGAEVQQAVATAGLDPALGFLHQSAPGRAAMVLDLLEVFRAGVDHFVLDHCDPAGPNQADWYYRDDTGCRLSKAARPRWFGAWAARRGDWPYPLRPTATDPGPGDPEPGPIETDQPEHTPPTLPTNAIEPTWPSSPLREQINGWIERLRRELKHLADPTAP